MKEKLKTVSEKAIQKAKLLSCYVTMGLVAATVSPMAVSAEVKDPGTVVKAVLGVIVKIFPFVGGFFVLAGVFKLIMAYRNDQPEAQAGAARDIVIGAVFLAFAIFAWPAIEKAIG